MIFDFQISHHKVLRAFLLECVDLNLSDSPVMLHTTTNKCG